MGAAAGPGRLERLCCYALRPPVAHDRIHLTPDGQVALDLRHRWADGTTRLMFDPIELLERLAALTPRPRINLLLLRRVAFGRCYSRDMNAVRQALAGDPRIAYALLFGSSARATAHESSDLDVAVAFREGVTMDTRSLGELVSALESAAHGRRVDLLLIDEAPPPVAYRAFRDGVIMVENDHRALVERKARAILEYLDFRPFEELAARGVLSAAAHGRQGRSRR